MRVLCTAAALLRQRSAWTYGLSSLAFGGSAVALLRPPRPRPPVVVAGAWRV